MKLNKETLKRIIKEELDAVVSEASDLDSFYALGQEEREGIRDLLDSDDPSLVNMGKSLLDAFEINGQLFYRFKNFLRSYNDGLLTTKEMKNFLGRTFGLDEDSIEKALERLREREEFPMIDPEGSSEKLYQRKK